MSLRFLLFPCLLLLLTPPVQAETLVPTEIGGFKLGEDITEYPDIEYANYLREVVINDWHGFRKGIIYYGTCAYPGTIVKIRLKYEDSSKGFYEKLLREYKKKFGKPTEWKGDAFGILYVWKWSFIDPDGRRVSLTLQHNKQDPNETIGNQVKMSFPEREEEERLCFIEYCEDTKTPEEKARIEERMKPDWDFMIPR